MRNPVPEPGFLRYVPYARLSLIVTPGMPLAESPTQSVLRNWGEERRKMPWRFSSSYLSVSRRVSRIGAP